ALALAVQIKDVGKSSARGFPTNLRNIRQTIVKLSELIIVYPCLSNRSQTAISLHFLQYPARAVLLTITGGTVEKTQPQSVACIALFARLHATEIGPVILESSFWYRSKRPSCFIRSSSEYAWTGWSNSSRGPTYRGPKLSELDSEFLSRDRGCFGFQRGDWYQYSRCCFSL